MLQEDLQVANSFGLRQATFFKTIANWNKVFRKMECFPHPNPYVQCGKRPFPLLLELYPDAKDQIVSFGIKNLATLTIDSVHDFIIATIVPRLTLLWRSENSADATSTDDVSVNGFLNAHGLKTLSLTTTRRWMRLLGFQYSTRQKSYYVDGHECDDVVATRSAYCKRHLTDLEPRCKRWVQLSVTTAQSMKDVQLEFGYLYHDLIKNGDMLEFHIDNWNRITREQKNQIPQLHNQFLPTTSI